MRKTPDLPLLRLSGLNLLYKERQLISNLSLSLEHGERLALLGESGAGKSLLAQAIFHLLPQQISASGSISFEGEDLTKTISDLRGGAIAYIPQDPLAASFPLYSMKKQWQDMCRSQKRKFELADAVYVLQMAGFTSPEAILNSFPHQLSGGELQRVLIAMAISGNPKLLIADEPTTALDTVNQEAILRLINLFCKERKVALIFISHDLSLLRHVCSRLVVIRNGAIVEEGKTPDVLVSPQNAYTRSLLDACRRMRHSTAMPAGTMPAEPFLEVRELEVVYSSARFFWERDRTTTATKKINLQVKPGRITGIAGKSGSGKTTLLRSLAGLIPGTERHVYYKGKPIEAMDEAERAGYRKNVQVIFQNPGSSLNPRMKVKALLKEALAAAGDETNLTINGLLNWVKLPPTLLDHYPWQLSGGEKQRLSIARSLALEPEILLCDEPTSSLDQPVQADLLDLFIYLKKELNLGILLISHNLTTIRYTCDDIAVMEDGEIKETGPAEKVLANPITPSTLQLIKAEPSLTRNFLLENLT